MITTTRTIRDLEGNSHYLEVGKDSLFLDGRACSFLEITHERLQFACLSEQEPITLSTATFWRDLAGAAPSVEDAGELLAHRLAAWASQQALIQALQSSMAQHQHSSGGSSLFPTYHLDSLTEQVLQAFDGTEATTHTLARILKQPPEVVGDWAARLGLVPASLADEQEVSTETAAPLTTGPLESLPPTESLEETPPACQNAGPKNPARQQFRWTPERVQTLEEAVARMGGLEQMRQPTIKKIAAELDWPWRSVEYKLDQCWRRKHPRVREASPEPAAKEEDRSESHEEQPVTAS